MNFLSIDHYPFIPVLPKLWRQAEVPEVEGKRWPEKACESSDNPHVPCDVHDAHRAPGMGARRGCALEALLADGSDLAMALVEDSMRFVRELIQIEQQLRAFSTDQILREIDADQRPK